MKKNYIFKTILFLIPFTAFVLMASSGGRDDGRTGSPGDGGNSCTACHTGGSTGVSVAITTNIPNGGYETNTQYDVTVSSTSSTNTNGFQLTAEKTTDNAKVGTFAAGSGSRVTGSRITHSNSGQKSWSFKWTSPATDVGNVKFYAATVSANGNGSNDNGDKVALTSTSDFSVLSLAKENQLDFTVFPNPVSEYLNIQLPTGTTNANISVFDMTGKLIRNNAISVGNTKVGVSDLSTGVYILKLNSEGKLGSRQFIKE